MSLQVNGKTLDTDEEGYLANLSDWEPEVAQVMAQADECDLSDNHWEVINFLRSYYEEYQIAPAVRVPHQGHRQEARQGQGQQQVPVPALPLRPGQAGLPVRRAAEADRVRVVGAGSLAACVDLGAWRRPPADRYQPATLPAFRRRAAAGCSERHRDRAGDLRGSPERLVPPETPPPSRRRRSSARQRQRQ